VIRAGGTADSVLKLTLRPGYHVNSNTPSDDYLIPLKITWNAGPVEASGFTFPKPQMEKYAFSDKPLSVFTGDFEVITHFKARANAAPGPATITGKLRYQACNNTMCLSPKTIDLSLAAEIVK
jgi:DsbC/DsbD-like thiol-disulfide interchange protein